MMNMNAASTRFWIWSGALALGLCAIYLGYTVATALRSPTGQPTAQAQTPHQGSDSTAWEVDPPSLPAMGTTLPGRSDAVASSTLPAASPTSRPPPADEEFKQLVRAQAEYFRQQSARNTDPDGINQLTPAEIEEMEKQGILAW